MKTTENQNKKLIRMEIHTQKKIKNKSNNKVQKKKMIFGIRKVKFT